MHYSLKNQCITNKKKIQCGKFSGREQAPGIQRSIIVLKYILIFRIETQIISITIIESDDENNNRKKCLTGNPLSVHVFAADHGFSVLSLSGPSQVETKHEKEHNSIRIIFLDISTY